jgi:hypothetical protein
MNTPPHTVIESRQMDFETLRFRSTATTVVHMIWCANQRHEKLTVTQLVKNLSGLMEPESLLPCSQEPATSHNPQPHKSSQQLQNLFP